MTFLLSFLFLITPLSSEYEASDYCLELADVLAEAVKDEVITYKEAGEMYERCLTIAP